MCLGCGEAGRLGESHVGKNYCPKCRKGTTAKQLNLKAMCGPCAKVYERWGFQETLDSIPQEVEQVLAETIRETPNLSKAASSMKKKYPLKHPKREWDLTLVILLDERRRTHEL